MDQLKKEKVKVDLLGKELVNLKKKLREAKRDNNEKAIKEYEKKVDDASKVFERAKLKRDEIESKIWNYERNI